MKNSQLLTRSSLLAVALLWTACGGGGGGGAPTVPSNGAAIGGSLRMPQVAPTSAANIDAPMVPGEVVVWFEPGRSALE